jgi:spermidine synthase
MDNGARVNAAPDAASSAVPDKSDGPRLHAGELALLVSVFVVAACGLLYELAAGTLASWLLGDSVLQFSTIIGAYLFAMGIGSFFSRYVQRQLVATFLSVELLVATLGGLMPALLFLAHHALQASGASTHAFRGLLYAMVLLVGMLVGFEIPLVMRILKAQFSERWRLSELVSQVLTFDYLGALAVSLAFPLLFLPQLGLVRTGVAFGLMNAAVALWALWLFRATLRRRAWFATAAVLVIGALAGTGVAADSITTWAEQRHFGERIVHASNSRYQRIVVTSAPSGQRRLFLNGNLQFDSRDEYRYHEALVHPAMAAHGAPKRVAVLGGGDGLAVREVLKHPSVESVTLVELDGEVSRLFKDNEALAALNKQALRSPKVRIVNEDAYTWLEQTSQTFDVIVIDFPDPSNFTLGKLYTTTFYELVDQRLAASGYAVVQSTSPLVARQSFWSVVTTLEAVGFRTMPYHATVASFGEWGFVIASRRPWRLPTELPEGLRFVTVEGIQAMAHFPPDMSRVSAPVNRLSNQALVQVFEREWGKARDD